ncbi:MAG: hypothetical protein M1827_005882 [Pycnora praestabilis]|nr:MAG: hypothetical protein M1827_005882 [Pycnora praestabilis]
MEDPTQSTLLMLNLPASPLCGIDLLSFTASPRFQGVKNLPHGWHFIFIGTTTTLSMRHGIWFKLGVKGAESTEVIIKKWDPEKEELVKERDEAVQLRSKANLGAIWKDGLTPYRQPAAVAAGSKVEGATVLDSGDWEHLTDCITPTMLSKITGGDWNDWGLTSATSAKQEMEDISTFASESSAIQPERPLDFLPINLKQTWREGAVGRERTKAAKDRSWALGDLIRNHCSFGDENEIVGEMQFTFLMVLLLNNYSCMEQWKRLLTLVFTCQQAAKDQSALFVRIVKLLRLQLQHCNDVDGGLFDLSDEGGTMLKTLLRVFKRGLDEELDEEDSEVKDMLEDLEAYVKSAYGWELNDAFVRRGMVNLEDGERVELEVEDMEGEDERGDYAPVIVDLEDARLSTSSPFDEATPLEGVSIAANSPSNADS